MPGRERHRHGLLCHGLRARTRVLGSAPARPLAGGARGDLRFDERHHRPHPFGRHRRRRIGRLRPPRRLCGTSGCTMVQAVSGLRDGADPRNGLADRLAAAQPAAGRCDAAGAWRLQARQCPHPPDRAARRRRARLGTVDAGKPDRRLRLSRHELAAGTRSVPRPGGCRSSGHRNSRRGRLSCPVSAADGPAPVRRLGLLFGPFNVPDRLDHAGIARRSLDGTASNHDAAAIGAKARPIAEIAVALARGAGRI